MPKGKREVPAKRDEMPEVFSSSLAHAPYGSSLAVSEPFLGGCFTSPGVGFPTIGPSERLSARLVGLTGSFEA